MPKQKQITGQEALDKLMEGNRRFVTGQLLHPHRTEEARLGLVSGQSPCAVILTCSDSRLLPVDVFDQGLGDLFVIRVAGGVLNDQIMGSIEYAVDHLKTPLVVIMSHESCGAITAVSQGVKLPGHTATLTPSIDAALKRAQVQGGNLINNAAKELALSMAQEVTNSEPILADQIKSGKVMVVACYYELASGEVTLLSNDQDTVPIYSPI